MTSALAFSQSSIIALDQLCPGLIRFAFLLRFGTCRGPCVEPVAGELHTPRLHVKARHRGACFVGDITFACGDQVRELLPAYFKFGECRSVRPAMLLNASHQYTAKREHAKQRICPTQLLPHSGKRVGVEIRVSRPQCRSSGRSASAAFTAASASTGDVSMPNSLRGQKLRTIRRRSKPPLQVDVEQFARGFGLTQVA